MPLPGLFLHVPKGAAGICVSWAETLFLALSSKDWQRDQFETHLSQDSKALETLTTSFHDSSSEASQDFPKFAGTATFACWACLRLKPTGNS